MIQLQPPTPIHDLRYTEQKEIFEIMDTESLLINHRKFMDCLKNPLHVDSWPAMQYSRQRIEEQLKRKGIQITLNQEKP